MALHKKWIFPLRISSVNMTRSAVLQRIWSHLLKKSLMKNFIFCAVWCVCVGDVLAWITCYYIVIVLIEIMSLRKRCRIFTFKRKVKRCFKQIWTVIWRASVGDMLLLLFFIIFEMLFFKISLRNNNFIGNNITIGLNILGINKIDVSYCLLSNISVLLSKSLWQSKTYLR